MKKCIIENTDLSYILHVDGMGIPFNGGFAAKYFKEHYQKLGYLIEEIDTWQRGGQDETIQAD